MDEYKDIIYRYIVLILKYLLKFIYMQEVFILSIIGQRKPDVTLVIVNLSSRQSLQLYQKDKFSYLLWHGRQCFQHDAVDLPVLSIMTKLPEIN